MINDMIANSENNELKSTIPCSICGEMKHPEETAICEVCVNCYCYLCGSLIDDICENCEDWSD